MCSASTSRARAKYFSFTSFAMFFQRIPNLRVQYQRFQYTISTPLQLQCHCVAAARARPKAKQSPARREAGRNGHSSKKLRVYVLLYTRNICSVLLQTSESTRKELHERLNVERFRKKRRSTAKAKQTPAGREGGKRGQSLRKL